MSRAFRRANQVFSALMVVVGIVLVWSARTDSGGAMNVFWALGVVLIVYGVVRYVAWSRYRGREE